MPVTVRVNMLVSRSRIDFHQRRIKNHPLQKNTGVVSTSWIQPEVVGLGSQARTAGIISPIDKANTGRVRANATQNRGRNTRSSGSPMYTGSVESDSATSGEEECECMRA